MHNTTDRTEWYENFVVYDTETTGLYASDEILQISAIRYIKLNTYEVQNGQAIPVDAEIMPLQTFLDMLGVETDLVKYATFNAYIYPKKGISASAEAINHISLDFFSDMNPEKIEAEKVLREFLDFVGKDVLTGWYVTYDRKMVNSNANRAGIRVDFKEHPHFDSKSLAACFNTIPRDLREDYYSDEDKLQLFSQGLLPDNKLITVSDYIYYLSHGILNPENALAHEAMYDCQNTANSYLFMLEYLDKYQRGVQPDRFHKAEHGITKDFVTVYTADGSMIYQFKTPKVSFKNTEQPYETNVPVKPVQ
jgi:DNA polymerase III epsilon subunit-like protein